MQRQSSQAKATRPSSEAAQSPADSIVVETSRRDFLKYAGSLVSYLTMGDKSDVFKFVAAVTERLPLDSAAFAKPWAENLDAFEIGHDAISALRARCLPEEIELDDSCQADLEQSTVHCCQAGVEFTLAQNLYHYAEILPLFRQLAPLQRYLSPLLDPQINLTGRQPSADLGADVIAPPLTPASFRVWKRDLKDPESEVREALAECGHAEVSPELEAQLLQRRQRGLQLYEAFQQALHADPELRDELDLDAEGFQSDFIEPLLETAEILPRLFSALTSPTNPTQCPIPEWVKRSLPLSNDAQAQALLTDPEFKLRTDVMDSFEVCQAALQELQTYQRSRHQLLHDQLPDDEWGKAIVRDSAAKRPAPEKLTEALSELEQHCRALRERLQIEPPERVRQLIEEGYLEEHQSTRHSSHPSELHFLRMPARPRFFAEQALLGTQAASRAEYRGSLSYTEVLESAEPATPLLAGPRQASAFAHGSGPGWRLSFSPKSDF